MEIPHLPGDPGDPSPGCTTLLGKEPLNAYGAFRLKGHSSLGSTGTTNHRAHF